MHACIHSVLCSLRVIVSEHCKSVPSVITDGKVFIYILKIRGGPKHCLVGCHLSSSVKMKIDFDISQDDKIIYELVPKPMQCSTRYTQIRKFTK